MTRTEIKALDMEQLEAIEEHEDVEEHAFITLEEAKRAARMAYKIAMLDEKKDLYRRLNNVQV